MKQKANMYSVHIAFIAGAKNVKKAAHMSSLQRSWSFLGNNCESIAGVEL